MLLSSELVSTHRSFEEGFLGSVDPGLICLRPSPLIVVLNFSAINMHMIASTTRLTEIIFVIHVSFRIISPAINGSITDRLSGRTSVTKYFTGLS